MMTARIEYREKRAGAWTLWTNRQGTREEILESARGLLEDLRG